MSPRRPRIGFLFSYLAYEYDTSMWRGLLRAAEPRGVDLIAVECFPDPAQTEAALRAQRSVIEGVGLDGMVVSGTMGFTFLDHQIEDFLASLPLVPIVLIGRRFAERPSVFVDNRAGIIAMVGHLVQAHGRRSIAFIAGHAHGRDAMQRLAGYREALGMNGLPYDSLLVYQPSGEYDPFVGAKAVDALWGKDGRYPDAFVAQNDDGAISAVRELTRRGIAVPEKVSVTGFDDIGPCLDTRPPLTTLRQPHTEIGEAAVDIVLKALGGVAPDPAPLTVLGTPVFRRSCGCSPSQAESYSMSSLPPRIAHAHTVAMEALERTIEESLACGNTEIFLDAFDSALGEENSYEPMFELWLGRLRRMTAARVPREDDARAAARARLFEGGLERLGNAASVRERSRGARTRNSYNVLNGFFSRSAFSFDAVGRSKALEEALPQLEIHEFLLCLYEGTEGPARVELVIPAGPEPCLSAGEMGTPKGLINRFLECRAAHGREGPLVVMRLYHDESDIGFFICGVGDRDGSLYLALENQLSSKLKGNALLEAVRGYSRELESKVATLSGFLPICASCKKIRDDKGYWNQIDAYLSEHSEVEFTHSLCPDCVKKLYPQVR
jgi:DNA-binding LacI/PurR family transcriptional regulator